MLKSSYYFLNLQTNLSYLIESELIAYILSMRKDKDLDRMSACLLLWIPISCHDLCLFYVILSDYLILEYYFEYLSSQAFVYSQCVLNYLIGKFFQQNHLCKYTFLNILYLKKYSTFKY